MEKTKRKSKTGKQRTPGHRLGVYLISALLLTESAPIPAAWGDPAEFQHSSAVLLEQELPPETLSEPSSTAVVPAEIPPAPLPPPKILEQETPPGPRIEATFILREDYEAQQRAAGAPESGILQSGSLPKPESLTPARERVHAELERALRSWPKGELEDQLIFRMDVEQKRCRIGEDIRATFRMANSTQRDFYVQPNEGAIFVWAESDENAFMISGERYVEFKKGKRKARGLASAEKKLGSAELSEWRLPVNFEAYGAEEERILFWGKSGKIRLHPFYVKRTGRDQGVLRARPVELTLYAS